MLQVNDVQIEKMVKSAGRDSVLICWYCKNEAEGAARAPPPEEARGGAISNMENTVREVMKYIEVAICR